MFVLQLAASMDVVDADGGVADADVAHNGVQKLFNFMMAGLVGSTPHMISATILSLARLVYDFGHRLGGLVEELVPAVLLLFQSKSREIIKAALGFMKASSGRALLDVLYLVDMSVGTD